SRNPELPERKPRQKPESVVIVGSGAAGTVCAQRLRRDGYDLPIVLLGDEAPVDRPNLSKDYLAGQAPEEWLPLRPDSFFEEQKVQLRLGDVVASIDRDKREVVLKNGDRIGYGALLLAPGAEPRKLPIPGAERSHVYTLRTLDDSRAIIEAAKKAK